MPRKQNCLCRSIRFNPEVIYFKPVGVPVNSLSEVELSLEEVEALRLSHVEGLEQIEASEKLKTSQSSYQRILHSAYDKVASALIKGEAIKITKHNK